MTKTHLQYVREHPCMKCGIIPSQAHHLIEGRSSQHKRGDHYAVPLCWRCHAKLHDEVGDESKFLNGRGFVVARALAVTSPCVKARQAYYDNLIMEGE